ncbi:Rib/alpha-like domain-containing protein, partial [Streptococcus sp. 20-1249]|uniref:Rib/alpha-like domain-containing protein n=1 Tax=Streptococcus hepaticus TaxID=3349163 RepID=UPI003747BE62
MFKEHSNREKQRFGFRKYKVGVASVLLAVAFSGAVLPSFVAPMATIVYAGTRIPGSKAELNDAAAKSVDLANIANFDFTSLLIVDPGYHAKLNYVKVGTTYGTLEKNFSEITDAKATGTATVNFVIIDDNTGQPYTKQDGQVDLVSPSILVTNTPPAIPDKDKYQPTTEGITVPKRSVITVEDIKGKVTIPEGSGGIIKTVGEIPSTSTDGVKTPVTVTVEYPDGTSDEVTVPVTVTPADDPATDSITVPQDEPITEDLVKSKVTIPDGTGGTIKSVGEIPSTTTAGVKPPVTVVVEYPNGDTVEVTVPVTVTPKVPSTTPIEVPQHSIVTEDVVKGKVVIPEGSGGKITNVGTIPTTNTAGEKPAVPVTVTYDDGTSIVVDVPVTVTPVTPTAGEITVP